MIETVIETPREKIEIIETQKQTQTQAKTQSNTRREIPEEVLKRLFQYE